MPKKPSGISQEHFRSVMTKYTEDLMHARLDLLTLQTALIDTGVISNADLGRAVEKITRESKSIQDDLEANPEKLKAALLGKKPKVH
jgi:hypothetical protein